jgi:hypothetical protein
MSVTGLFLLPPKVLFGFLGCPRLGLLASKVGLANRPALNKTMDDDPHGGLEYRGFLASI